MKLAAQHAPHACGNADHRYLPSPRPPPREGQTGQVSFRTPPLSFWSSRACLQLPSTLNCRAEPDTGHGIPEGHGQPVRGDRQAPTPSPQQGATPPSRVGGGPGHSGRSTEEPDAGEESGAEEKERPADVHEAPGSPAETRLEARPPAPAETLPAGASLLQLHFPPPAHHHPYRAPARHLRVRRAPAPASRTPPGTRDVRRPGVGLRRGSCQLRTTITGLGLRLRRHLAAAGAAPRRPRKRRRGGQAVRTARGGAYGTYAGIGAGPAGWPRQPQTLGKRADPDPETGMRERDCALDTFAQNLNGWYHCLIFMHYSLIFLFSRVSANKFYREVPSYK